MKKSITLLSFVLISVALIAKTHVPESKNIVGIWRQTGAMSMNGEIIRIKSGNYKVINPDGTYYTFIAWGLNEPTVVGLYGTYKMTSDSTITENIIKHANPSMNGKESKIRFRLIDENTMLIMWNANGNWIPEHWTRLQFTK